MSTHEIKHIVAPYIVVVVVALLYTLYTATPTHPENTTITFNTPTRNEDTELQHFQNSDFYRTIIDNNLFRPLGWTPPRPTEPYRLIGTLLPRSETTPPKAIIQTTTGEKTYIVTTGEPLDASTKVISIESKSVTLSTNGQQRTLHLNTAVYLNASAATRKPIRTTETPHRLRPIEAPVNRARPAEITTLPNPKPTSTHRGAPLSDWESRDGQAIPVGDARLKNPQKWGLHRR